MSDNPPLPRPPAPRPPEPLDFLAGGGAMGELIRSTDWARTPLGPIASWPQSLRSAISILLPSRAQIILFWGDDLTALYNDAYAPVFGAKHPWALGRPARECWAEIWDDVLGPLFTGVLRSGEAFFAQDHGFFLDRHGYLEETYFDVSYDPVRIESGAVGGIFCIVSETTGRVLERRRLRTMRDLSTRSLSEARTVEEACRIAAKTLGENDRDVPFALLYLVDPGRSTARLAGAAGIAAGTAQSPLTISLASPISCPSAGVVNGETTGPGDTRGGRWPLSRVAESGRSELVDTTGFVGLPAGGWDVPPRSALILPVGAPGQELPAALLIAGVNPRRPLDDTYQNFFHTIAGYISTAIANARAYEEERRRAEMLSELDAAKTLFFTNVSHEFRTPLTLMLGPVESLLQQPANGLLPEERHELGLVHRQGLRLLKLVNTLLDFSRIEAGRADAVYERTDVALLTRELASMFCTKVETAGMRLVVDCPAVAAPVFIDRDMWEKIVLNLMSNAFKFTFEGGIEVRLREVEGAIELTVLDTGVGIPAADLPHVLERFHRVEGTRRRSQEGTGIGLALVYELTKLHGGAVGVESSEGRGTRITVSIPTGSAHLPPDRIGAPRSRSSTAIAPGFYVGEAGSWLAQGVTPEAAPGDGLAAGAGALVGAGAPPAGSRPRIVLAEDNADMRLFVGRLLGQEFEVEAVGDGRAAMEAIRRRRPDLVLTDVMMPEMSGFELLTQIRTDPELRGIPLIMLSARAGQEAMIEGVEAGADDYLVKPFSARDLLARVRTHLGLARVRREAEQRITGILESITDGFQVIDGGWHITYLNHEAKRFFAANGVDPDSLIGKELWNDVFPGSRDSEAARHFARAMTERVPVVFEEHHSGAKKWYASRVYPLADGGLAHYFQDVTERKRVEEALTEANRRKDEFLAVLAHELRNPLAPISHSFEILRQSGISGPAAERVFEMMERQVSHMVRLVDDLLEISRITRGQIELRRKPVELAAVIRNAVETSMPLIDARRHQLAVTHPSAPLIVDADAVRLSQVFANLLNNAAKYTDEGGRIALTVRHDEDQVAVSVRDNGVGIPEEMLSRVFDLFAQVDRSAARAQGGLGIGLTLVRSLVEMHGGQVEVRSDGPGHGTEFIVRLQLAAGRTAEPVPARDPRVLSRLRLRVLVVDDNRDAADSLEMLLRLGGTECHVAYDGPAALAALAAHQPDVVLLDLGMPGMDGFEVARRVRQDAESARVRLVALTGWGQEEDRRRARAAGFDHHLIKPVDIGDLQTLLASLVNTRVNQE
jgi:PAS domain S-box-containing protein